MQTTVQTIPAGTSVQTPTGRSATTVDDTMLVRNSETGTVTGTNLIRFSDDDEVCPGGEWLWDASQLTPLRDLMPQLRLIDADGYTVPGSVRATTPETDAQIRVDLNRLAEEHAAEWADFGYHPASYRIV